MHAKSSGAGQHYVWSGYGRDERKRAAQLATPRLLPLVAPSQSRRQEERRMPNPPAPARITLCQRFSTHL